MFEIGLRMCVQTLSTLLLVLLNTSLDLHNETGTARRSPLHDADVLVPVNIHTHLHASILFAFFLGTFSNSDFKAYEDLSWADYAVFVAFLSSAVFCLLCSAFYHMASSHSKQVSVIQPAQ